ncbi:MAG: nitroreductase family protein [Christensenellaceae bacterium]|nr:nitroreductase family protein [Christensenellaceae bacterium]
MNRIIIDREKCIGCGLCVKDCVSAHLTLENQKARASETSCIECGHCFAVCPENAITMTGYDCTNEAVSAMTEFDSDKLLSAIKSRRSIRHFKKQAVEEEKLQKILEAGRYSPTGSNAQDVTFTILGSKQNEAEELCVNLFRKGKKVGAAFNDYLKNLNITDDFFFKGAPLVIVLSSKSSINAGLASSYMELMAYNLGLGVLYSGFFVICTKLSKKLRDLLQLPANHEVVSCMVIGYPDIKYRRIPPRKELNVKVL